MKIELRNVKYAAFASQETACFEATVYLDGVVAGRASNEGQGGSDHITPQDLRESLDAYGKTLPMDTTYPDHPLQQNAELLIGQALNEWLAIRDVRLKIKKKMVFTRKGVKGVFSVGFKQPQALEAVLADKGMLESFKHRHGVDTILNMLPIEQAAKILLEAA